jgi:hypothetical protein
MRDIPTRSAFTLLTTALFAGCGSVHGIPINQTASDIAESVCAKAWACCSVDQLKNNGSSGADVSTDSEPCTRDSYAKCEQACESKTAEDFRNYLADIQRSVDQKRAVYEEAKVKACLKTIREDSCENLNMSYHLTGVPGCDSFASPLVAMGGACSKDYECTSGWCKPAATAGDGTCAAPMSGMSCAVDGCGRGFACDGRGTNDQADDVCVQLQDNGLSCSGGVQCKSGNCTNNTCMPPAGACFYGSGCSAAGGAPSVAALLLVLGLAGFAARGRARRRASN